uniref:flagellar cap protein FliD N-terminal domain-containing protein n=1 Tax=Sphingomonas bacterium TaxID=1895847 RepID=UPI00266FC22B
MATSATTSTTASTSSTASIVKTLGSGSGLDTGAIVTGLVQAQFAVKNATLTKQADALTAQISAIAKLKSGITGFDSALKALVKGGTLTTQPLSSAAGVATAAGTGASAA